MTPPPDITVIMATWNRGRHILPSVRSVLAQTHGNFELLVIGDALTDDTAAHLDRIADDRLRFFNLDTRYGSQFGPNNAGLDAARAPIAAYCGHDDIWAPDHLSRLLAAYRDRPELDAVASGLIMRGDWAEFPASVFGLFEDAIPFAHRHYTPPSAFSHRIDKGGRIRWRGRHEALHPVDRDFVLQLAERGYVFGSTRAVTVHKWAAGRRYLDYLRPRSDLQQATLDALLAGSADAETERLIGIARRNGHFMPSQERAAERLADAAFLQQTDSRRGLDLPDLIPLGQGVEWSQDSGDRAMDWFPASAPPDGLRWCGPSPEPHLLLPVVGEGAVRFEIETVAIRETGFPPLSVSFNDSPVPHDLTARFHLARFVVGRLTVTGRARPDRPSILGFHLPPDQFAGDPPHRLKGFAVGGVRAWPEERP
jgi:hypothetical protein